MRITIDRDISTPVYRQIADQIRDLILSGEFGPGRRLPAERKLAESLGVNRSTIINAYGELQASGLVESRFGRGTTVLAAPLGSPPAGDRQAAPLPWRQFFGETAGRTREPLLRDLMELAGREDIISFAAGIPAPETYPLDAFREIQDQVLRDHGRAALQHSPTEGHLPLRETICQIMHARGVNCSPDEILVLSGSQQGLDLAARVFVDQGDVVLVEEPSFFCAVQVFQTSGARVIGVPLDEGGVRLDVLETLLSRYQPKFVYTLPTFQNPSGVTMSLERRLALLELAYRYQVPVLEDDPYGELRYEGKFVPALKALDRNGYVIYLSTFSKVLFPGLRVGWMVAPRPVARQFALARQLVDLHSNTLAQWLIDGFFRRGLFDVHIAGVRRENERRRNTMQLALGRKAPPGFRFNRPEGGLYLWCTLPSGMNGSRLLAHATEHGVTFVPGEPFYAGGQGQDHIRLNYSYLPPDRIEEGVARLVTVIRESTSHGREMPAGVVPGMMPIV
ncbi:MAG: PLP-dependent aminotransferase family protein [Firmicutes bacterium]|nr:PLP-dependent aminotransferase family protein [Bacillota bacterium]